MTSVKVFLGRPRFAEILRDYVLIISSCSCCMIKLPQVILYERRYICNLKISFIAIQKLQHRTNQHLLEHELIKVRLLETVDGDKKELATEMAQHSQSHVAQIIGKTIVLYRAHPEEPTIKID